MELIEIAKKYFEFFSNKDIQNLKNLFSENIILKDWEIEANGIKSVLEANQNIFNSVDSIVVSLRNIYQDKLVQFLQQENLMYFRGDEKDIIKRLFDAANFYNTDIVIDVEGDDFFTDPLLVDKLALEMKNSSFDFICMI